MVRIPETSQLALSVGFAVIALFFTQAQRFGEWRSKPGAVVLASIAAILSVFWLYYVALWAFSVDLWGITTGFGTGVWISTTVVVCLGIGWGIMRKFFKRKDRLGRQKAKGPSGLEVEPPRRGVTILNSSSFNNGGAGIRIANPDVDVHIEGTSIYGNKGGGIVFGDDKSDKESEPDPPKS